MSNTLKNKLSFALTTIKGVHLIKREPNKDTRGSFARIYCNKELKKINIKKTICQVNYSETILKGTVRGMHFQLNPYKEEKIVTCLRGSIFDVVVDLRYNSPTFLQWHAEILSSENNNSLAIPEGCAHGFQTLEDDCKLIYLHTEIYNPDFEGSINAMDPMVGINWPMPVSEISNKDANHPFIDELYLGVLKNEM